MHTRPEKLYLTLFLVLISGYLWLGTVFLTNYSHSGDISGFCIIKYLTGIPCPACGSTRSVMALIGGDFSEAFFLNPSGFIIALIALALPVWMLWDYSTKNQSLYRFYCQAENVIRRPPVAATLIVLVIANWIWNIIKSLK